MSEERHLFRHTRPDGGPQTNWHAYGLDEIWQMVSDEDGQISWQQYDSWRRTAELCDDQADQLGKAMAELLERWPARPGSAAWAFKTFVDGLISSMRQSAATAAQTREALREITIGLATARSDIAWLREERQRYEQAELALTPKPMPQPGQIPHTVPPDVHRPPANWRQALDQQARVVMAQTDVKIGTAATGIAVPPRFRPRIDEVDVAPGTSSGVPINGLGSKGAAPFIPVPGYVPPGSASPLNPVGSARPDDPTLDEAPPAPPLPGTITPTTGPGVVGAVGVPLPAAWIGLPGPRGASTSNRSTASTVRPAAATTGGAPAGPASTGSPAAGPLVAPPVGARPTATTSRPGVVPGGRQPMYRRRRDPRADRDDPWAVKQGGPAILEPPPEPLHHDPGPGVIGIDR